MSQESVLATHPYWNGSKAVSLNLILSRSYSEKSKASPFILALPQHRSHMTFMAPAMNQSPISQSPYLTFLLYLSISFTYISQSYQAIRTVAHKIPGTTFASQSSA